MKISTTDLHQKVTALLREGFSEEEASKTADYLVWAEMGGGHYSGYR